MKAIIFLVLVLCCALSFIVIYAHFVIGATLKEITAILKEITAKLRRFHG